MAIRRTTWAGRKPRMKGNRKNTRRWCKGVVGREHKLFPKSLGWIYADVCLNCGKRVKYRL